MSSDSPPIHRVTTAAAANRRATRSEAEPDEGQASADAGGVGARGEPKASEAQQARVRDCNPVVRSGSTPDRTAAGSHSDRTNALRRIPPPAPKLLNVGYGNLVSGLRIVAIVAPNASPMRRLRREAAERGKLVDATEGRRTRSILILDSDHVVLSAINPETLAARLVEESGDGVA